MWYSLLFCSALHFFLLVLSERVWEYLYILFRTVCHHIHGPLWIPLFVLLIVCVFSFNATVWGSRARKKCAFNGNFSKTEWIHVISPFAVYRAVQMSTTFSTEIFYNRLKMQVFIHTTPFQCCKRILLFHIVWTAFLNGFPYRIS